MNTQQNTKPRSQAMPLVPHVSGVLAWLDIETSGLNPVMDSILEIGVRLTDYEANPLGVEASWVIRPTDWDDVKKTMHPVVSRMHRRNGLIETIDKDDETTSLPLALNELCALLYGVGLLFPVNLAGTSVHFDRKFIEASSHRVFTAVSHRMVDVSSIDLMVRNLMPDRAAEVVDTDHRVATCLDNAISMYTHYLPLFRKPLDPDRTFDREVR
jgi:oligoribonuclease